MADPFDPAPDAGLRAARARQLRVYLIVGALVLSGAVIGFFSAMFEREGGAFLEGIGAGWAITASLVFVVAVLGGSWMFYRNVDELEKRDNYWASMVALNVYLTGYPVWYFLWRGELAPEPDHGLIFVGTMIVLMFGYFWKKLRP